MSFQSKFGYKAVADRDSTSESGDDETKSFLSGSATDNGSRRHPSWRILIVISILNVSILIISSTLFALLFHNNRNILNAEYRRTSAWSPVHDLIDLEPTIRKINGTFYNQRDGGSIARQQPNPAADAIWDEWELTRVYPATRETIIKMGSDPSTVAKLENDIWGLGDDAYATIFDVYHQIHCLNSLRHFAYGGYCEYPTPKF